MFRERTRVCFIPPPSPSLRTGLFKCNATGTGDGRAKSRVSPFILFPSLCLVLCFFIKVWSPPRVSRGAPRTSPSFCRDGTLLFSAIVARDTFPGFSTAASCVCARAVGGAQAPRRSGTSCDAFELKLLINQEITLYRAGSRVEAMRRFQAQGGLKPRGGFKRRVG